MDNETKDLETLLAEAKSDEALEVLEDEINNILESLKGNEDEEFLKESQVEDDFEESYTDLELMEALVEEGFEPSRENVEVLREALLLEEKKDDEEKPTSMDDADKAELEKYRKKDSDKKDKKERAKNIAKGVAKVAGAVALTALAGKNVSDAATEAKDSLKDVDVTETLKNQGEHKTNIEAQKDIETKIKDLEAKEAELTDKIRNHRDEYTEKGYNLKKEELNKTLIDKSHANQENLELKTKINNQNKAMDKIKDTAKETGSRFVQNVAVPGAGAVVLAKSGVKDLKKKKKLEESYTDLELMELLAEAEYEPTRENVNLLVEECYNADITPEELLSKLSNVHSEYTDGEYIDNDEEELSDSEKDAKYDDYMEDESKNIDILEKLTENASELTDLEILSILEELEYEPSRQNVELIRSFKEDVVDQNPEEKEAEEEGFDDGYIDNTDEAGVQPDYSNATEELDKTLEDSDIKDETLSLEEKPITEEACEEESEDEKEDPEEKDDEKDSKEEDEVEDNDEDKKEDEKSEDDEEVSEEELDEKINESFNELFGVLKEARDFEAEIKAKKEIINNITNNSTYNSDDVQDKIEKIQEEITELEKEQAEVKHESYSSLSEAFELGYEYFEDKEAKQGLIEAVSLSIASENNDRLFTEMVNATILAERLRTAILEKYNDLSENRINMIFAEQAQEIKEFDGENVIKDDIECDSEVSVGDTYDVEQKADEIVDVNFNLTFEDKDDVKEINIE